MVATGLAAGSYYNLIGDLHENILFLTPRRSLASLARAYWYNLYSYRFCPQSLAHYYTV